MLNKGEFDVIAEEIDWEEETVVYVQTKDEGIYQDLLQKLSGHNASFKPMSLPQADIAKKGVYVIHVTADYDAIHGFFNTLQWEVAYFN